MVDTEIAWTSLEVHGAGMERSRLIVAQSAKLAGCSVNHEHLRIQASDESRAEDVLLSSVLIQVSRDSNKADLSTAIPPTK